MIKPLTSLRFIFALMVFLNHLSFVKQGESEVWDWIFLNIFREGYIGVSFFFILSGFILAYNYQQKFLKGSVSKRQFWQARMARILPLYYLTLIASIPFTLLEFSTNPSAWIQKIVLNIFALQSFVPVYDYYFSFNLPAWSISNELFFYLIFPFLIPVIFKFNSKKLGIIGIAVLFLALMSIHLFDPSLHHTLFYINPVFRLIDFFLGIALYNIYKISDIKFWNNYYTASILEISSVIILLIFFGLHQYIPSAYRYSFYYWLPMMLVIYSFSFHSGVISKLLSYQSMVLLGEISFGFYLIHHLVIRYVLALNIKYFNFSSQFIIIVITLLGTVIASYFSYKIIEKPCRNYINRFNFRRSSHLSTTPSVAQIIKKEVVTGP
jgi:peptidoglycan/LPS O-acetylase OafA/YrhL